MDHPKRVPRTYQNQFRKDYAPPTDVLRALFYYKWQDDSWGNDVSPSWYQGGYKLWISEEDKERREDNYPRYNMTQLDDDGQWIADVFAVESPEHLITFLYLFNEHMN